MRDFNMEECIVFAINTTEDDAEYRMLRTTFKYYGLDPDLLIKAEGSYAGKQEQSYLYPWRHKASKLIRLIAQFYNQESVMYVSVDGRVLLYMMEDQLFSRIGELWKTSAGHAQQQAGYTRVGDDYFIVVED